MPDQPGPRFASFHIDCARRDPICPGCGVATKPGDVIYWIPQQASQDGEHGGWVCRECALRADQGERVNTKLVPRMEEDWGHVLLVPPWMCPPERLFTPAMVREVWPGYFPEPGQGGRGTAITKTAVLSTEKGCLSTEKATPVTTPQPPTAMTQLSLFPA